MGHLRGGLRQARGGIPEENQDLRIGWLGQGRQTGGVVPDNMRVYLGPNRSPS